MAFSPFTGGPITMDHENTVKAYSASPSMLGRGHSLMEPQGPVWVSYLSSDGSPCVHFSYDWKYAECTCLGFSSAAGRWCYRWNLFYHKYIEKNKTGRLSGMPFRSKKFWEPDFWPMSSWKIKKPFLVYKIFQMDYNRNTKEYRMLDCFLPQVLFPALSSPFLDIWLLTPKFFFKKF